MSPRRRTNMRTPILYTVAAGSVLCTVLALRTLLSTPDTAQVWIASNLRLLSLLALLAVAFLATGIALARQRGWRQRLSAAAVVLSLVVLAVWFQRYTDVGILLLGGDAVWVRAAAEAETPEARRTALLMALQGTEYALSTVETEILEGYRSEPGLQAELFLVLAEIAPTDRWREQYRGRSREALTGPSAAAN